MATNENTDSTDDSTDGRLRFADLTPDNLPEQGHTYDIRSRSGMGSLNWKRLRVTSPILYIPSPGSGLADCWLEFTGVLPDGAECRFSASIIYRDEAWYEIRETGEGGDE